MPHVSGRIRRIRHSGPAGGAGIIRSGVTGGFGDPAPTPGAGIVCPGAPVEFGVSFAGRRGSGKWTA